jgi:serine/threonine protein kinase
MNEVPLHINNYIIKEIIGSGEFSSVHFAYNLTTQEGCCAKVVEKSKENQYLIQNEIKILKSLNHPNIASFIDYVETKTHMMIFQELCRGKSLFEFIEENENLTETIAKRIFRQLIETLDYLQTKGISHLDIKPENIICNSDYRIKLIDFGFSSSGTDLLTTYYGSIHYSAPEILNSTPYHGKFADVWSCGIVLYAMINGRFPFCEETDLQTLIVIKKCEYEIPNTVSDSAANLIQLMLNLNPRKRIFPKEVLKHKWFENSSEPINLNNY